MKILLLIALPIEVCGFDFKHKDVDVVFTGVGKINACKTVGSVFLDNQYDYVINAGTCGSTKFDVGHILFPSIIYQGDAFITGSFESKVLHTKKITADFVKEVSILSSDNFISVESEMGDVFFDIRDKYDAFDMESYAIASVLEFMLDRLSFIKIVSDNLDGSTADWEFSAKNLSPILADCIERYIKRNFISDYEVHRI